MSSSLSCGLEKTKPVGSEGKVALPLPLAAVLSLGGDGASSSSVSEEMETGLDGASEEADFDGGGGEESATKSESSASSSSSSSSWDSILSSDSSLLEGAGVNFLLGG